MSNTKTVAYITITQNVINFIKNIMKIWKFNIFFLNGINVINILSHVPYFKNKQK